MLTRMASTAASLRMILKAVVTFSAVGAAADVEEVGREGAIAGAVERDRIHGRHRQNRRR